MTRPIAFFSVFWGGRFRQYFANILLRSLLAPGNLPCLERSEGHALLVCCPEDDWLALAEHPVIQAVRRHVEVVHLPVEPPPPGRHPVEHMTVGHIPAVQYCFEARAYGSLLHPDMLFADGFVAAVRRRIEGGTQALMVPALRLAKEPLFAALDLDAAVNSSEPLILAPRKVAGAVMASLHDEIIECEAEGPRLSILPNCVWWRNGASGMLVHSFSWSPLLIDYGAVARHETSNLGGPLADGDYVARNLAPGARVEFVADSDELVFASWTPGSVGARERRRSLLQNVPVVGGLMRDALLRRAYLYYTRDLYPFGDHVKAKGFPVALRLHTSNLDETWAALEAKAEGDIVRAIGDLLDPPRARPSRRTRLLDMMIPALKPYEGVQGAWRSLRHIGQRLAAAFKGDSDARAWITDRVRARLGI